MLTRRTTRVRGLREAALSLPLLGSLPGDLVKLILLLLPLDTRLRAREVCRGWCALLEDASFWTRVDLSASCGVNPRFLAVSRLALALLRAACLRAKGDLQSVDISEVHEGDDGVDNPFVLQWLDSASAANKASLRDLVAPTSVWLDHEQVAALCRTVPLCRVRCTVCYSPLEALPLLRREPPYELLTIGGLWVFDDEGVEQSILDLASALSVHKGMEKLTLYNVPLSTRAVDALVDNAISAGIKNVTLFACEFSQAALPALGRLIQSPGFEHLGVKNENNAVFEGPALPAFCDALRNSKCLRTLGLDFVNLWADLAAATQLFDALEGLLALRQLSLHGNPADGTPAVQRAAGECLVRLIARSSSLRVLNLLGNALGETGLAPIFEALRSNNSLAHVHLQEPISAEFARDVVLPAVCANTRLRMLTGLRLIYVEEDVDDEDEEEEELLPALREVENILEARRLADQEAA